MSHHPIKHLYCFNQIDRYDPIRFDSSYTKLEKSKSHLNEDGLSTPIYCIFDSTKTPLKV